MHGLIYNPDSGVFTWAEDRGRWGRIKAGTVAGHKKANGYVVINIDKKLLYAHRLVFEMEGGIPEGMEVDHINGDPSDNRRVNLRLCDSSENKFNTKRPKSNTTGVKNVHLDKGTGKYRVRIRCKGLHKHIGLYDTLEEASKAAQENREELHGVFSRGK